MRRMAAPTPRPQARPAQGVPEAVREDERTREIQGPAAEDGDADSTVAVPAPVCSETTVPVQSCIETTLLHEVLRRQSAERDDDDKTPSPLK